MDRVVPLVHYFTLWQKPRERNKIKIKKSINQSINININIKGSALKIMQEADDKDIIVTGNVLIEETFQVLEKFENPAGGALDLNTNGQYL